MNKRSRGQKTTRKRAQIIAAVHTPLSFFVLVVLVVEAILCAFGVLKQGLTQNIAVGGMLFVIVVLIVVVAFLAYKRPEALRGIRPGDLDHAVIDSPATSTQLYLNRAAIHWLPYNDSVCSRYWACGTSLIGVAERELPIALHRKGVRDIKIVLPATQWAAASFHQLDQYDKLMPKKTVDNQVSAAEKSYAALLEQVSSIALGRETDHIRLYSGIMYSNITIFDNDAFVAFYDYSGLGDNNITAHFNRTHDEAGYLRVQEEFLHIWKSGTKCWIREKKKGASIIFRNSDQKILLFLRDNKTGIPFPNQWDLLGGNVENNESPEKCIKREMVEEIETVIEPSLFNVYDMPDRIEFVFWQEKNLDLTSTRLNEGQRLRWFTQQEISSMSSDALAFEFRDILMDFFRKKPLHKGQEPCQGWTRA